MEQTIEWLEELEWFKRGYSGTYVIHANSGLIIAVMVPRSHGIKHPGNELKRLGFNTVEKQGNYYRFIIKEV